MTRGRPDGPPREDRRALGRWGEAQAAGWLRERGWRILEAGWHCRFGEIDLIAEDGLYRVIYGHNLHDGSMFNGLLNYRDEDFYAANPTFTLYTPEGAGTWRIFSCHTATDMEELYRTDRTAGEEYDAFLQQLLEASEYDTGAELPEGAQVVTLSTCLTSYGSGLERYVVHAYREG